MSDRDCPDIQWRFEPFSIASWFFSKTISRKGWHQWNAVSVVTSTDWRSSILQSDLQQLNRWISLNWNGLWNDFKWLRKVISTKWCAMVKSLNLSELTIPCKDRAIWTWSYRRQLVGKPFVALYHGVFQNDTRGCKQLEVFLWRQMQYVRRSVTISCDCIQKIRCILRDQHKTHCLHEIQWRLSNRFETSLSSVHT
jgi:hypothetical protein